MTAIKIDPASFKIRYVGSPSGSAAVKVIPYIDNDSNALADSNFMYFSSPTDPTVNEGLIGQLIIDGSTKNVGTGKNIDAISYNKKSGIQLHTENEALSQKANLVWSMGAGPHILRDNSLYTATWANRSGLRQNDNVQRVALGVNSNGLIILAYRDAITLSAMADYMKSLGCTDALAGDSGGSARLYLKDRKEFHGNDIRKVQVIPVALSYTFVSSTV